MARLSQRELDYEVPSFRHPKWIDWKGWAEHETTAYLAVVDDRVVGYALTRLRNIWGMVDLKRNPYDWMSGPIRHEATRPCIDMVFVSVRYRGQGIAASLLRFVAESNGVPVDHIVHTYPLSEPGSRLVRGFSVNGRYLVAVGP